MGVLGESKFGDKKLVDSPDENKAAYSSPSLVNITASFFFSHSNTTSQPVAVVGLGQDHYTFSTDGKF